MMFLFILKQIDWIDIVVDQVNLQNTAKMIMNVYEKGERYEYFYKVRMKCIDNTFKCSLCTILIK